MSIKGKDAWIGWEGGASRNRMEPIWSSRFLMRPITVKNYLQGNCGYFCGKPLTADLLKRDTPVQRQTDRND
ncbi:hypothetical protein [Mesorhizobium sp. Root552]|uniref:hypothetical protein n=1 Tax=Mesorhizobium sp. Root552 TaxID=1736555 RepID=UPI0012E81334|nr:hypothetical protein [Mesorhizobium sp. Root552]